MQRRGRRSGAAVALAARASARELGASGVAWLLRLSGKGETRCGKHSGRSACPSCVQRILGLSRVKPQGGPKAVAYRSLSAPDWIGAVERGGGSRKAISASDRTQIGWHGCLVEESACTVTFVTLRCATACRLRPPAIRRAAEGSALVRGAWLCGWRSSPAAWTARPTPKQRRRLISKQGRRQQGSHARRRRSCPQSRLLKWRYQ
jgi:hypothetical protein